MKWIKRLVVVLVVCFALYWVFALVLIATGPRM